ncbi:nuclear transport factor 2 family protein [Cytophaga aurantiaca]|uniref:nuclear transport factor 2 family protein n=1 Tax=Cytophaga aurantiaca TaxID=29530 RepID=UPI00036E6A34|nr:nuclear transport factor 2 family protein [Cytophaga aurantiaca]
MKDTDIEKVIRQLIKALNAFDVKTALTLFAADAVIDDISVGETFRNKSGVRHYLEKFFVGYNTVTKLESLEIISSKQANAQVDFTGNFGHETGALNVLINADGLIIGIDAHLD